jgi:hypothetical protein
MIASATDAKQLAVIGPPHRKRTGTGKQGDSRTIPQRRDSSRHRIPDDMDIRRSTARTRFWRACLGNT